MIYDSTLGGSTPTSRRVASPGDLSLLYSSFLCGAYPGARGSQFRNVRITTMQMLGSLRRRYTVDMMCSIWRVLTGYLPRYLCHSDGTFCITTAVESRRWAVRPGVRHAVRNAGWWRRYHPRTYIKRPQVRCHDQHHRPTSFRLHWIACRSLATTPLCATSPPSFPVFSLSHVVCSPVQLLAAALSPLIRQRVQALRKLPAMSQKPIYALPSTSSLLP